jgi:ABC-type microcin C transport system permease subunit YejB
MLAYVVKRLLLMIPTLLGVLLLTLMPDIATWLPTLSYGK